MGVKEVSLFPYWFSVTVDRGVSEPTTEGDKLEELLMASTMWGSANILHKDENRTQPTTNFPHGRKKWKKQFVSFTSLVRFDVTSPCIGERLRLLFVYHQGCRLFTHNDERRRTKTNDDDDDNFESLESHTNLKRVHFFWCILCILCILYILCIPEQKKNRATKIKRALCFFTSG